MRRIWVIIGMVAVLGVFEGCTRSEEGWIYGAPNWTSDNKICFLEYHYVQRYRATLWSEELWGALVKNFV